MNERKRNWSYLFIGSLILLASFSMFIWKHYFIGWALELTAAIIGIYGLIQLYQGIIGLWNEKIQKTTYLYLLTGIALIIFSIWLFNHTIFSVEVLSYIIGGYQLIIGMVNVVNYFLLKRDGVSDRFFRIIYAVIHILMGFATLTDSLTNPQVINRLALYILFIGLTYLNDGRGALISDNQSQQLKRKFRFPLPVIFHALLPQKTIRHVNQFIEEELDLSEEHLENHQRQSDQNKPVASENILQVQISMSTNDLDILGHTNIIYQNKVYTYGNHDVDSRRLMMLIGDGVLAVCDKESYLDYTLKKGTTIVEYDILLTDAQKEALQEKLSEIKENTYPWMPETPTQLASNGGNLIRETNTKLHKFKEGRYRTYFALGTNCVLLTDDIIGVSGLDLFVMVGVLTPGTFYDYFEKEYKKEHSIIVNRKVYNEALLDYLELETY
jgi:hypothetical protein